MNKVPGVDISSGSLGQGLSCANGMAIAGRQEPVLQGRPESPNGRAASRDAARRADRRRPFDRGL